MERETAPDTIDLGAASIETQGPLGDKFDVIGQQEPANGLTDD
jgi:hypothetical protein